MVEYRKNTTTIRFIDTIYLDNNSVKNVYLFRNHSTFNIIVENPVESVERMFIYLGITVVTKTKTKHKVNSVDC